jgi:DNA repair exonuclease SbcCD ATPase subunit
MIIANPIYDVVFKFLMKDERTAKFFIETLLDETIEEVHFAPQEYAFLSQLDDPDPKIREEAKAQLVERISISVFRLDFVATIKTKEGDLKKVLIEIQKAKNAIDLIRFRNYLGEQYKKQEEISGKKHVLPIITIYMLGFNLPEIDTAVVKVNRQYLDLVNQQVIVNKSDFIEKLTHDCYVIQVNKIEPKFQTRLDRLLTVFEQKYFYYDDNMLKAYDYPIKDDEIKKMIDDLHYAGTDPAERKRMEDEKEAYRVLDWATEAKYEELKVKMSEAEKKIEESEKKIEESEKKIEENEKKIQESKKKIEEREKKLEENRRLIAEKELKMRENQKVMEEKDKLIEELLKKINQK